MRNLHFDSAMRLNFLSLVVLLRQTNSLGACTFTKDQDRATYIQRRTAQRRSLTVTGEREGCAISTMNKTLAERPFLTYLACPGGPRNGR